MAHKFVILKCHRRPGGGLGGGRATYSFARARSRSSSPITMTTTLLNVYAIIALVLARRRWWLALQKTIHRNVQFPCNSATATEKNSRPELMDICYSSSTLLLCVAVVRRWLSYYSYVHTYILGKVESILRWGFRCSLTTYRTCFSQHRPETFKRQVGSWGRSGMSSRRLEEKVINSIAYVACAEYHGNVH